MLSPNGDPAEPAGSSGAAPAGRGGPQLVDALLFLALIAFVLVVLDVATGWALAGLMHLGRGGVVSLSVAVGLPLAYVGYVIARTALANLKRPGGTAPPPEEGLNGRP